MAIGLGAALRSIWCALTGRKAKHQDTHVESTRTGVEAGTSTAVTPPLALATLVAPSARALDLPALPPMPPMPVIAAIGGDAVDAFPHDGAAVAIPSAEAKYVRSRRDFRLAARLAATSSLNKPIARKSIPTVAIVATARRGIATKPKVVAPARHVWLASKPMMPATSGQVIALPTAGERARRLARAA